MYIFYINATLGIVFSGYCFLVVNLWIDKRLIILFGLSLL